MPKKIIRHAQLRCMQRKGMPLSRAKNNMFLQQIQDGTAKKIKNTSLTRSRWRVKDKENNEYVVVYSKKTKKIITVLE